MSRSGEATGPVVGDVANGPDATPDHRPDAAAAAGPPGIARSVSVPDFFIIGAPKSGTTTLHHWLASDPSIHMSPIREPCFFAPVVIDYTERVRGCRTYTPMTRASCRI